MSDKALAPINPNVFLAFDRLDDNQIVAEMKGAALQEYVYEFSEGGQQVRGLSKAGTDDASRIMAVKYGEALREIRVTLEFQNEDEALFTALVERWIIREDGIPLQMDSAVGQKRQGKKVVRRDGKTSLNPFWYEQGGQKALRNAKQKLIPETIKQAIIASYVEQGKVRTVKAEDLGEPGESGAQQDKEHWCSVHNVEFRKFTAKDGSGKTWYSHSYQEAGKEKPSWCNERDAAPEAPRTNGKPPEQGKSEKDEVEQLLAQFGQLYKQCKAAGLTELPTFKRPCTLSQAKETVATIQAIWDGSGAEQEAMPV